MNKFSYDLYINLIDDMERLIKRLKDVNKEEYASTDVQESAYDIISLANSLHMYIRHYKRRNNIA